MQILFSTGEVAQHRWGPPTPWCWAVITSPWPNIVGSRRAPRRTEGFLLQTQHWSPFQPQLWGDSKCWQDAFALFTNIKYHAECHLRKLAFSFWYFYPHNSKINNHQLGGEVWITLHLVYHCPEGGMKPPWLLFSFLHPGNKVCHFQTKVRGTENSLRSGEL